VGVIFIAVIIALIVIFVRRSRATGQLPDTESPAAEMNETEIIETYGINPVITESQGPDTSTTLVFGTYAPADPYHPKEFGYKIPTLPIGFSLWDHEIVEFGSESDGLVEREITADSMWSLNTQRLPFIE
jgi:hypothetical protein